ncbi:MAG TPA: type II toxin-antitoxin system HicB family antitoxin [Usitatibacter sp.]|jgi:predicted RNase H-like HicB family nuclease|nr:type II toxin-antitoxin system HicB family antitoxin [Usitatibacter sp.]
MAAVAGRSTGSLDIFMMSLGPFQEVEVECSPEIVGASSESSPNSVAGFAIAASKETGASSLPTYLSSHSQQRPEASGAEEVRRTMQYLVVVEKGATSFGAYVPDLPGCVAAAETRDEVVSLIREAIEFHLEGLREDGQPIPEPSSFSEIVDVKAA